MAYEKMDRSFPCLCGSGEMIAEWEEHDTWPSPNRRIQWSFACANCAAEYEFYSHLVGLYTVRRGDADRHRELVRQYKSASIRVYEVASAKYEQRWVNYVLSRGTKAAMHRAIAPTTTYATFAKHAKYEGWVEREARNKFRSYPKDCLDRLGIEDAEVSELNAAVEARRKEASDFWENTKKTAVPFR
jgi:hypothetical protein